MRKAMHRGRRTYKAQRAKHLLKKEAELIEQQEKGKLQNYSVVKNVSDTSNVNAGNGKIKRDIFLYSVRT